MLGIILGIAITVGAVVLVLTKGDSDHVFRYTPPDPSTPQGRRARLVMLGILAFLVLAAYLLAFKSGGSEGQAYSMFATFIVLTIFGTRWLRRPFSRHQDRKDKDKD